jgi:hypothetical protein
MSEENVELVRETPPPDLTLPASGSSGEGAIPKLHGDVSLYEIEPGFVPGE